MKTNFIKAEIETTETWIIRRPRYFIRSWCGECAREVSLLIPEEAARLACLELRKFYVLMENNRLHIHYFGEAAKRQPYICLNSLCLI